MKEDEDVQRPGSCSEWGLQLEHNVKVEECLSIVAVVLQVALNRIWKCITGRVTMSRGQSGLMGMEILGRICSASLGKRRERFLRCRHAISHGTRYRISVENLWKSPSTQYCLPGIQSGPLEVLHILWCCCSSWYCCLEHICHACLQLLAFDLECCCTKRSFLKFEWCCWTSPWLALPLEGKEGKEWDP